MAKATLPAELSGLGDEPLEIELKEPWLAAILAWLLPGLGHLYQGRRGKGVLFFICVLGTFIYGLCLGEGKVVYASSPGQEPWRWQYYCQLGVGLPALPALVQRSRFQQGKPPLWEDAFDGLMYPPNMNTTPLEDDSGNESTQPDELAAQIIEMHPRHELGTVFTVIAGLLNLLVICDAYAGPLVLQRKDLDETKPDEPPQTEVKPDPASLGASRGDVGPATTSLGRAGRTGDASGGDASGARGDAEVADRDSTFPSPAAEKRAKNRGRKK